MAISSPSLEETPYPNRRHDLRASLPPDRRPVLRLPPGGAYQVLDISLRGLRIRHFDPVRPGFGEHVSGTLEFADARPHHELHGIIVRVQAADVAIRCDEGVLPAGWVQEEVARAAMARS